MDLPVHLSLWIIPKLLSSYSSTVHNVHSTSSGSLTTSLVNKAEHILSKNLQLSLVSIISATVSTKSGSFPFGQNTVENSATASFFSSSEILDKTSTSSIPQISYSLSSNSMLTSVTTTTDSFLPTTTDLIHSSLVNSLVSDTILSSSQLIQAQPERTISSSTEMRDVPLQDNFHLRTTLSTSSSDQYVVASKTITLTTSTLENRYGGFTDAYNNHDNPTTSFAHSSSTAMDVITISPILNTTGLLEPSINNATDDDDLFITLPIRDSLSSVIFTSSKSSTSNSNLFAQSTMNWISASNQVHIHYLSSIISSQAALSDAMLPLSSEFLLPQGKPEDLSRTSAVPFISYGHSASIVSLDGVGKDKYPKWSSSLSTVVDSSDEVFHKASSIRQLNSDHPRVPITTTSTLINKSILLSRYQSVEVAPSISSQSTSSLSCINQDKSTVSSLHHLDEVNHSYHHTNWDSSSSMSMFPTSITTSKLSSGKNSA